MPLIVDKAERRAMVAAVAFDLVADNGIGAVTFRQVAEATGSSTAIVTNYFHDKTDLLFEVYRIANRRAMDRLEEALAQGLELADILVRVLPVAEEMQRNWRVWFAFWSLAHSDAAFRQETGANAQASVELYCRMLANRYALPLSDPRLEPAARQLVVTVGGAGLQASFAPDAWPLARLRSIIADQIAMLDSQLAS